MSELSAVRLFIRGSEYLAPNSQHTVAGWRPADHQSWAWSGAAKSECATAAAACPTQLISAKHYYCKCRKCTDLHSLLIPSFRHFIRIEEFHFACPAVGQFDASPLRFGQNCGQLCGIWPSTWPRAQTWQHRGAVEQTSLKPAQSISDFGPSLQPGCCLYFRHGLIYFYDGGRCERCILHIFGQMAFMFCINLIYG